MGDEPESVEVNGNGHRDPIGIGPTTELVLGSDYHADGNGANGHEEAPEQHSLFSWAEFVAEEPVKPKGRSRKPQPASASLFDWAVNMERQREEELVGARR